MGKGLLGKRVAIGGSRKTEEISTIIEKQGGIPVIRPLQGTVYLAEKQVEPDLRTFVEGKKTDWVIFTTGIGLETLVDMAEKIGLKDEFLQAIRQAKAACRGYKTLSALKKLGITPEASDEDGTTRGLIRSLEGLTTFQEKQSWCSFMAKKRRLSWHFLKKKARLSCRFCLISTSRRRRKRWSGYAES